MPDSRPRGFLSALVLTLLAVACAQTAHAQQSASAAAPAGAAQASGEARAAEKTAPRTTNAPAAAVADDDKKTPAASSSNDITTAPLTAAARKPLPFAVPRDEVFAPRRQDDQSGSQSNSTYTPLTSEQKMKRAFKSAFLSPAGYAWTAFNATLTEMGEEDLPHKDTGDRFADGMSRFAIQFGRRATRSLLGSGVYPAIFKQEPRYIKSTRKGFAPRALYAVSRVFVTRGDGGGSQFNISRVAGNISASALSNLWEQNTPGHDRIGTGPTFRRVATMFLSDALFNIFREFW